MPTGIYPRKPCSEETKQKIAKALWKGGKPKCKECGKLLSSYSVKKCRKCYTSSLKGEKHPNWKGGRPVKIWRQEHRELANFWTSQRRKRLKNSEGKHTFEEWLEVKRKHNYSCAICLKSELEIKLVQDHIIPISKGGNNYISNIQPLCGHCNSVKHNRVIVS